MSTMASQITSLTILYSSVYCGAEENTKAPRRWPLDDVIMSSRESRDFVSITVYDEWQ